MITVSKDSTLPNGLTAAYSKIAPTVGDSVSVLWRDDEGTAIVMKTTPILSGQLHLVYLDVDWSSFERFPDGE